MSWVFGPGGGGTPGGADKDIQFNNNGEFSGSNLLTTDGSGSLSASTHVSASTFYGDGSNLTGVTASAVQVADGPQYSLQFRFDSPVSGDLSGSANFVVSSDMSTFFITGSTILSGALSSSDIVPLADEQYGIGTSTTGYESAYIKYLNGAVAFDAVNKEGATISKGQVVYLSGADGGNPAVALAACDVAAKMPAFGIVADGSITNNNTGRIVTFGDLTNITQVTASFSDGDLLYVQTGSNGTSGSLTNVAPTGSGNALQNIGKVIDASAGRIKVISIGRTNATPNLDKGHIFVGNETDQAIQDSTIFVSASAERVGINKTVPAAALHVSASSVHGGESARFEGQVVITSPDGELYVQDTTNNKQIKASANAAPTLEFGNSVSDSWEYFYIQGGATSKIITKSNLNAFIISDTTAGTEGITYKPTQARVGINTPTPSHAFTVNGDTYVTGAISASVGIEVSSSANGSISIGEGIIYTYGGLDRIDAVEDSFKLRDVEYYKAVSTVQTTNFNIQGFQTFLVDTTGSVITGTLPGLTSDGQIGLTYTIKDYAGSGSTNNIVIEPSGSQEIDGGTAAEIQTDYGALVVAISSSVNGLGWGIVSAT